MNNMAKNWKSILIYLLIPVLLIGAIIFFSNQQTKVDVKYSDIVTVFKNDEVKEFIISTRKASTSLIQRKFSIGYARAARLIDTLEDNGIIGPARGSKPREVYAKSEQAEEE